MRVEVSALDCTGAEDSLELVIHDMRNDGIDVIDPIFIIRWKEDDDVAARLRQAESQAGAAAMAACRKLECLYSPYRASNLQSTVPRSAVDQDHLFTEADCAEIERF